eukprot:TRINITY_DN10326_c0_g1_i1.p1 TRINITY_DN10326_c0_g1~~TRINITY_DN10326_c0_g1_i1.p1  ORF type:complete len:306 (+),score=90.55 TRINITY_DN10326_c0_g1_i1:32-949(+)
MPRNKKSVVVEEEDVMPEDQDQSGDELDDRQSEDLYAVLEVTKDASIAEIRKSYYKLALKCHPDRNAGDVEATEKFQRIGRAYEVLSDTKKKAFYDKTGCIEGEEFFGEKSEQEWMEHWRAMFKQVSFEDIDAYQSTYKGSQQEVDDLKDTYNKVKGDLEELLTYMVLADESQLPRYVEIIQSLIKKGELKSTVAFKKTLKRVDSIMASGESEAQEAEQLYEAIKNAAKNRATNPMAVTKRSKTVGQRNTEAMFASIAAKYGVPEDDVNMDEPSEEDFLRARERLEQKKTETKAPSKRKRKPVKK